MISSSHFVAFSFLLFVGLLLYKRFFNIGSHIDRAINKIDHDIQHARAVKEEAKSKLEDAQLKLLTIEAKIINIHEKNHKIIETLTNQKMLQIAEAEQSFENVYSKQMNYLEQFHTRMYSTQLVDRIMTDVRERLSNHPDKSFLDRQVTLAIKHVDALYAA